jgi:hypothetical protein
MFGLIHCLSAASLASHRHTTLGGAAISIERVTSGIGSSTSYLSVMNY